MTSSIIDGKVYDWRWVRRKVDTVFYIGETMIGQLFKINKSWSAVHRLPSKNNGPVHGFKTRHLASEFLAQIDPLTAQK
jgi:hypothetical protein